MNAAEKKAYLTIGLPIWVFQKPMMILNLYLYTEPKMYTKQLK